MNLVCNTLILMILNCRSAFINSLLANFHIHFIQVTYNGYSTFYDDMTAIQHSYAWLNMLTPVEFNNETATVKVRLNFDLRRTVDKRRVRVGLALYEILVIGDEHAKVLHESWPYRYMGSSRDIAGRLLLLRNVKVGNCSIIDPDTGLETKSLHQEYYEDHSNLTKSPPNNGKTVWPIVLPLASRSKTTTFRPFSPPANDHGSKVGTIELNNGSGDADGEPKGNLISLTTRTPESTDTGWRDLLENMWAWWIWAVVGTLVGIVIFATIGAFCFW